LKTLISLLLFCLTAGVNAADLSGMWVGYYGYGPNGAQETQFAMVIKQQGNTVQATIIEPVTFGDQRATFRQAQVLGQISGDQVQFIKQYNDGQKSAPVSYTLTLLEDVVLAGQWSINNEKGPVRIARIEAQDVKKFFEDLGI